MKHWHIWLPFLVGQFGFDFGGPGDFFGSIIGAIVAELQAALAFLFNLLVAVTNYLLSVLQFIFRFFLTLVQDIQKAFKWLWTNIVKVTLAKILAAYARIRQVLGPIFSHVLLWLQKARALLDYYYRRFIRPYLILIQHTRQVLTVFRLLGFKWAKRLDARLAGIEAKIISVFELVRVPLNQIISFVSLLANPLGILRRNPVISAVLRSAPEVKNAIDRATFHTQTQAELDKSNRANGWFQQGAVAGNAAYYQRRELPPDVVAARQEFLDAGPALPSLANQEL